MERLDELVGQARKRRPQPMPARERAVAGASALGFLAAVVGLNALVPDDRPAHALPLAGLVLAYGVARRVTFEIGNGEASPPQLVLIPMLFLAPVHLVPLLVAAGELTARLPDFVLKRVHGDRWLHALSNSWYAIGPALVIGLLAPGPPKLANVGIYTVALAAQALLGLSEAIVVDRLMYGTAGTEVLRAAGWAYRIDAVLTPVAYMVAAVAVKAPLAVAGILPVFWLLRTFSEERRQRYAAALELNQAYRGTVMVLADVVEAEDNYTADHCRSVVELSAAVGEELGLGYDEKQELEIAALLHDVGKIAIPDEILNKPSKLTEEEFEVMKTHTIEGQALLNRVGGRLSRIGEIVRSCHERWDGKGYPDGLAGAEIPRPARIVFACDAYSAMTTDRPYRRALSKETALEELAGNAGTQFEPKVVAALAKVVSTWDEFATDNYSDAVRAVLASQPSTTPVRVPV
jgi:HD-GYP domain-containing protein (c-di-GMP phosphodiesterase class II)